MRILSTFLFLLTNSLFRSPRLATRDANRSFQTKADWSARAILSASHNRPNPARRQRAVPFLFTSHRIRDFFYLLYFQTITAAREATITAIIKAVIIILPAGTRAGDTTNSKTATEAEAVAGVTTIATTVTARIGGITIAVNPTSTAAVVDKARVALRGVALVISEEVVGVTTVEAAEAATKALAIVGRTISNDENIVFLSDI